MKRVKEGEKVMVTVPATVVMAGRAGYMAQIDQPVGFVYYKKPKKKRT